MRKKIWGVLTIIFMVTLIGCGRETTKESDIKEVDKLVISEKSEDVETTEETELTARENADSLNVENDKFTFEQLALQIGDTEENLTVFLEIETVAESYEAVLFGENVTIKTSVDAGVVEGMTLTFADTNADSLFIAISEQLGQDGIDEDSVTNWTFEEKTVTLSQSDEGCVVDIK